MVHFYEYNSQNPANLTERASMAKFSLTNNHMEPKKLIFFKWANAFFSLKNNQQKANSKYIFLHFLGFLQ